MKSILLKKKVLVPAFFVLVVLVGLIAFRSYGISWDEKALYVLGSMGYDTVFSGKAWPTSTGIRFHGAWLEIVIKTIENILSLNYARHVFWLRHIVSYLFCSVGLFFFYLLSSRYFKNWKIGLIAALALFISPRIFAHSFYNTRDVPTLYLYVISMFTLINYLDKKDVKSAVLHGLACGLLIDLRMTGIFVPVLTFVFEFLECFKSKGRSGNAFVDFHASFFIYVLALAIFTIMFWPLLWTHPIKHFVDALSYMSSKSPGGFYFGQHISVNPWHWIPVWMFITTPILYTLFFIIGIYAHIKNAGKRIIFTH